MRLFLVALAALFFSTGALSEPMRITTWGGDHGSVFSQQLIQPFKQTRGGTFQVNESDGSGAHTSADVVEMELYDVIDACDRDLLHHLPIERLRVSDEKPIEDFASNTLQPCAVGQMVWSTVVTFDKTRYRESHQPSLISDFFNTDIYPGKRALRRSPRHLAEWALASRSIPVRDIYSTLDSTAVSWSLVKAALDDIGDSIVWVDSDAEAMQLMRRGIVTFAMVYSSSAARHALNPNTEVGIIWDAAIAHASLLAIPRSTVDFEKSWEFLEFATSKEMSARFSSHFGYAPARQSALHLVNSSLHPFLTVSNDHLATAIWGNSKWWRERGERITDLFSRWLQQWQTLAQRPVTEASIGFLAHAGKTVFAQEEYSVFSHVP